MQTRFGIKVLGISFRTEFINDAEISKPWEIHLELVDFELIKSPPLIINNNWKEDKWDPTQIYWCEIKGQVTTANWYWERAVEMDIHNEDESRDLIDYFRESTIEIEIFNGLSEMRVGVFKLPLWYFLKRGEKYMWRGLKCEISDSDWWYIIVEIFIVLENETVRPIPPNSDERTTEKKGNKYKKKVYSEPMNIEWMARKTQESFGAKLNAVADKPINVKTEFAGNNDEKWKWIRVERMKHNGGIVFHDIYNIGKN